MKFKFIVTLLIALLITTVAQAAKVDIYKDAINNKTFTLKYKINVFPTHVTNKQANIQIKLFDTKVLDNDARGIDEVNSGGIIVVDKDNRYVESFHDAYQVGSGDFTSKVKEGGRARLIKDGEVFGFFVGFKDGVKNYYAGKNFLSGKSKKVKAITTEKLAKQEERYAKYRNPYEKMFSEYNYAALGLFSAFEPILPPDKVIATPNTPIYKFVGSGTLDNGLSYEDFYGEKNNSVHAIRYYFDGDNMVKIAMFNYIKDDDNILSYSKYVIDIEEFLTTADEKYLQLPEGLQDATKRDKDGGKK